MTLISAGNWNGPAGSASANARRSTPRNPVLALVIAARSMAAVTPAPIAGSLDGLLAKLLDQLPEDLREELVAISGKVDFVPSATPSKGQEWVAPLMDAMRQRFTIEMTYFAAGRNAETAIQHGERTQRIKQVDHQFVGYADKTANSRAKSCFCGSSGFAIR